MVEVQASVDIAAPVDVVVGVLLDPARAPLWTDGLERLEVVRGVPGEAGCVGRASYRGSFGRTVVMTDTLDVANPGRFYRSTIHGGGITAVVETHLDRTDSDTRMVMEWSGTGSHLAANLTLRLFRRGITRRAHADLARLAALAEGDVVSG
mgnify:FL=1